jgi:hypothetical protein
MSANRIQTPGNYPEESIQHSDITVYGCTDIQDGVEVKEQQ